MNKQEPKDEIASLREQISTLRLLLGIRQDTIDSLRAVLKHVSELTSRKTENDDV